MGSVWEACGKRGDVWGTCAVSVRQGSSKCVGVFRKCVGSVWDVCGRGLVTCSGGMGGWGCAWDVSP